MICTFTCHVCSTIPIPSQSFDGIGLAQVLTVNRLYRLPLSGEMSVQFMNNTVSFWNAQSGRTLNVSFIVITKYTAVMVINMQSLNSKPLCFQLTATHLNLCNVSQSIVGKGAKDMSHVPT